MRCGDPRSRSDIRLGAWVAEPGSDQGPELEGVCEFGIGVQGLFQLRECGAEVLGPCQWALPRWARAFRGSRSKARLEVGGGADLVVAEPGEAPGDEQVRIVGAGADRLAERLLRILATTQPRQGLGVCRQHGRDFSPSVDAAPEVGQGLLGITQLQVRQAAIDPGVDELAVDLQGTIVGGQGLDEPAASREGQAAIQMRPGEMRRQDRAGREVRGGVRMSALIAVADPQGEPGPEQARIDGWRPGSRRSSARSAWPMTRYEVPER